MRVEALDDNAGKSIYTFYDSEHNECNDNSAVTYIIREYGNDGSLIRETEHRVEENMKVGKTPAGGVYSIAYFFDENGNSCKPKDAVRMIGVEFDREGKPIQETHLLSNKEPERKHPRCAKKGIFRFFR